jgi:hypothetical protein
MNLTAHWELKMVALVLAVALWIYTGAQVRSERTVDVKIRPVDVSGLNENYRVTDIAPASFRVTLSVPSGLSGQVNDVINPTLEISSQAYSKRAQGFPLTSALLGLSSDIRILRTEPDSLREVTVAWDYVVPDDIPAAVPAISGLPSGLEAEVILDHNFVHVRAPSEAFDRLRKNGGMLRYLPLDLSSCDARATGEQTRTVELIAQPDQPFQIMQKQDARVVVRPVSGARLAVSVPVQVLAPAATLGRLQAEISERTVTLSVHGPENLLKQLKPEGGSLTAYVDLRGLSGPVADQELPVLVIGPSWLTADPVTVRVTVTAVSRPADAAEPAHDHGSATAAEEAPAHGATAAAPSGGATVPAAASWPLPWPVTAP